MRRLIIALAAIAALFSITITAGPASAQSYAHSCSVNSRSAGFLEAVTTGTYLTSVDGFTSEFDSRGAGITIQVLNNAGTVVWSRSAQDPTHAEVNAGALYLLTSISQVRSRHAVTYSSTDCWNYLNL